jgi:hypothetical protein
MQSKTYEKGGYTARVFVETAGDEGYRGMVAVDGPEGAPANAPGVGVHRVEAISTSEREAFEEAHALAHRVLAGLGGG